MDTLQKTIEQVERYAEARGIAPATVCRLATNNPRLFDRLKRRVEQVKADVDRLQEYMSSNPANGGSDAQ